MKRLQFQELKLLYGLTVIEPLLQPWIHWSDNIYLNTNENDRKANWVPVRDYRYAEEMKRKYPLHNYKRSAQILKRLRAIKTALEIEVMQKAIDITDNTFRRLLQFIKPGVLEYEIEAEIFHSFLMQRATGPAYGSIIASGDRARTFIMFPTTRNVKMVK